MCDEGSIATKPVATEQPAPVSTQTKAAPDPTLPPTAGRRPSGVFEKFGGPLLAAAITSITVVVAHSWIVPTVARHQRRIDRMYQAMFDAEQSVRLLYGYAWNVWNERRRGAGATNAPLEDFQEAEAKAASLTLQLALIFGDDIAADWERVVRGYHDVAYPITHPGEFPVEPTKPEMNERLNPLSQRAGDVTRRIQAVIRETEGRPWWRVLLSHER